MWGRAERPSTWHSVGIPMPTRRAAARIVSPGRGSIAMPSIVDFSSATRTPVREDPWAEAFEHLQQRHRNELTERAQARVAHDRQ